MKASGRRDGRPRGGELNRAISGALIDTINQHGPIGKELVHSATKRVENAVLNWMQQQTEHVYKQLEQSGDGC